MKIWSSLLLLFLSSSAFAISNLKDIVVQKDNQVQILFDSKVDRSQFQVEFLEGLVQVSIDRAAVYPAKMFPVTGSLFTKIFAYQYSPTLVRFRLSMKGKSENLKDHFEIQVDDRTVTLKGGDALAVPAQEITEAAAEEVSDKRLMDTVMQSQAARLDSLPPEQDSNGRRVKTARVDSARSVTSDPSTHLDSSEGQERLEKGPAKEKRFPSVWSALLKLCGVLSLFVGIVFGLRRLSQSRAFARSPLLKSPFFKAFQEAMGTSLGKESKVIQVVSKYALEPKKSITVVKVYDRVLVLGVTQDSIQLITQLPEQALAQTGQGTSQSEHSNSEFSEVLNSLNSGGFEEEKSADPGVRTRIKRTVEGLKPL